MDVGPPLVSIQSFFVDIVHIDMYLCCSIFLPCGGYYTLNDFGCNMVVLIIIETRLLQSCYYYVKLFQIFKYVYQCTLGWKSSCNNLF